MSAKLSHSWHASHATALESCHLLLHLHHVRHHGFFDLGIILTHEVHDGALEFIRLNAVFNKERVFRLRLVDELIDHHFHLVAAALSRLALHGCLLLHRVHRK